MPEFEKQQQRTLAGWSLRGEFVKCTWMNTTGLNGLYFCFMLYGCLYFRISAYAALKMNVGIRWYNESYTSLCHNVTQVVTWPITSYGGAAEKSPAPRAPINRFGKKNSFHFNSEIEKPFHWFNFWKSVILSVWPNDDDYYTFSIQKYRSAMRTCV